MHNASFHIRSDAFHMSQCPLYLHATPSSPHLATSVPCGHPHGDSPRCLPARRSIPVPSGLSPSGCCGGEQPDNHAREPCQNRGNYRGRKGGRVGAWGGHCGFVSYCPVVLRNFMYTRAHTYCLVTNTHGLPKFFSHLTHTRSQTVHGDAAPAQARDKVPKCRL